MEKKILLIAPLFFDYYKDIIAELENLGYSVTFFPDTHSDSNFIKAAGRVNKNLINNKTHKYFLSTVLPQIKDIRYSKILIIAALSFSYLPEDIGMIKELNDGAPIIGYLWDSKMNNPYFKTIYKYLSKIYTFDRTDSESNSEYTFLPLFYTTDFQNISSESNSDNKYDCSYIGTAHPKKYEEINRISKALKHAMPHQFIYHYMPSKLKFWYHKFSAKEYRHARLTDFRYKRLTRKEIISVMENSFCILDAPQKGQSGLTMRTIECLGARKKLITTNPDIVNYDFYDAQNILVFNDHINVYSNFFTSPYRDIPLEIYEKYSLTYWLKTLLQ